jgi:hypothetical protein
VVRLRSVVLAVVARPWQGSFGAGGGEVRGRFGVFGVMNRCGETQI